MQAFPLKIPVAGSLHSRRVYFGYILVIFWLYFGCSCSDLFTLFFDIFYSSISIILCGLCSYCLLKMLLFHYSDRSATR